MSGIDATTGEIVGGFDHVQQSIEKIISTAQGQRIMREWFGNPGTRLLGELANERTILLWFTIVWAIIELFEPRFRIKRFVNNSFSRDGTGDFYMDGEYRPYAHLDFVQARLFVSVSGDRVTVQSADR